MMSNAMPSTGRGAWRIPAAGAVVLTMWLAGCTDSVVPAPTGQLDGGGAGGGAPNGFVNEVPRNPPGPPVGGAATGTGGRRTPHDAAAAGTAAVAANTGSQSAGVGNKFYEAAAEFSSNGPAGPAVLPDARDAEAAERFAADYPPLATFDRSAAESLPAPDAKQPYASIVDPAEGEIAATIDSLDLAANAADIDSVRFSAPASAQAIIASRVTVAGQRDATRLDRHDLTKDAKVSEVTLPDRATLLDVSPDGTRALVRLAFGLSPDARPVNMQTRLDVWELGEETGRHIVGWQPGATGDNVAVPLGGAFLDGDRVVTLTDDGLLTLWNLAEQKAIYTVPTGARGPLLMTPGRKYLAAFTGTTFATFEAATGAYRGLLTPPRPTLAACRNAGFSPDGTQLAAVMRRPAQSILGWDLAGGRPAFELDAPLGLGKGLHFGSSGYVVAGGVLFDVARKKPVWLYVENSNSRNVAASPDRRHWVVTRPAFRDGTVLEAVAAPTEEVAEAAQSAADLVTPRLRPGDSLAVRLDLAKFSADREAFETSLARELARTLDERGLRFDDDAELAIEIKAAARRTGETISFDGSENVPAHDVPFSLAIVDADGKSLWSGSGRVPPSYFLEKQPDRTLEEVLLETLWQSAPAAIAATLDESMPAYIRATPPEATLGQTRLWAGADDVSRPGRSQMVAADDPSESGDPIADAPARQPSMRVTISSTAVREVAVIPAPYNWIAATCDDGILRIGQLTQQAASLRRIDDVRSSSGATRIAMHPHGEYFAFGTEKGEIRSYDLDRRRAGGGFNGASGTITALAFTHEPTLVAGTQGGRVYSWPESNPTTPNQIADGQAAVTGLAGVPFTNRVVVSWLDGTAKVLDAGTGQLVRDLNVQAGAIHGISMSPEGQQVMLATETGGVLVSLDTGSVVDRFEEGPVTAVAFRPDAMQVATGSRSGRIVLWKIADRQPDSRLEGAGGQVDSIVYSSDGQAVAATITGRREVPVWSLSSSVSTSRTMPSSGRAGTDGAHSGPRAVMRGDSSNRGPGRFSRPDDGHSG